MDGAADWRADKIALNATTATLISAAKNGKRRVLIRNLDASISIYVGASDAITASADSFLVKADETLPLYVTGEVYAISASGTPDVNIIEEWD